MAKNEFDITSLTPEQRDARLALDVERLLRFGRKHKLIKDLDILVARNTLLDLLALAAGSEKLTREEGCQYLTRVGLCANDYIDREVDASLSGGEVKREATLIVISHQERIIDLADEIVMIRDGKIAKHGPKDEIFPQILANTSAGCSYMSEGAR